jgi:AraC-like DNA-binding protein
MQNIYETIRSSLYFNKFEFGELLFVEYKCPLESESAGIWSQADYLVHVLAGKKTWRTTQGSWTIEPGQTLYIKKGAAIVEQFFDDDFCMLGFFISDDFIRNVVREADAQPEPLPDEQKQPSAIEVKSDLVLSAYFQSMLAYFSGAGKPSETLLTLKLKELLVHLLTSAENSELAAYFLSLARAGETSVRNIMEANFCFNLSLKEFARLSHRSLSTFKRDFKKHYGMPPGKWLQDKRLARSAVLLRNSSTTVTEIAFECGFENLSHFSRAFKAKFGVNPANFRANPAAS